MADEVFDLVVSRISLERQRQDAKWGEQDHDDYVWHAILSEEVGEVAQAILHTNVGGSTAGKLRVN